MKKSLTAGMIISIIPVIATILFYVPSKASVDQKIELIRKSNMERHEALLREIRASRVLLDDIYGLLRKKRS